MKVTSILAAMVVMISLSGLPMLQADTQYSQRNIVETLVQAPGFTTLVAAVQAAGLAETLKNEGPLTLLAPSDKAFAKLPQGTVEDLLKPENLGKLKAILTFHVIPGRITLSQQVRGSLEGTPLNFMAAGPMVVNGAEIVMADIPASNGIIHVIDSVLLPGSKETSERQVAEKLILNSIDRGVLLFNSGDMEASVAIYAQTVQNMLGLSPDTLPDAERGRLQKAMRAFDNQPNPREQAWILRRAMDATLLELRMPHDSSAVPEAGALLVDDFSQDSMISPLGTQWRLFTDRVMGGVSNATSSYETLDGRRCLRMKGDVSLENNGGFVQLALSLKPDGSAFDGGSYKGIRLWTRGNGDDYYIHLRTNRTRLPWQYYSAPFTAKGSWNQIDIPFDQFEAQNLGTELDSSALLRIAIVGANKAFEADVAVSRIEFYR